MSSNEPSATSEAGTNLPVSEAYQGLEDAVGRLLSQLELSRAEARDARKQLKETARAVSGLEGSSAEGVLDRVRQLEVENEDLRTRIVSGMDVVKKLQAKIRFLEETA